MGFANHILSGFSLGFKHRRELGQLLQMTPTQCCITTLDIQKLHLEGIRVLALDFDGVLAPHGAPAPLPAAIEWLEKCATLFGEGNLFILSNKPTEERKEWFHHHFPAIRFIAGVRKKPFPDGIVSICELSHTASSKVLMVDDRLLTGCLAALETGARPCYIRKPYIALSANRIPEMFFMAVRVAERLFMMVCRHI